MVNEVRRATLSAVAMVALFSMLMNVLLLIVPLYSLQVYDRVFTSHSGETLFWLTVLAVFMIGVLAVLDALRGRILVRVSLWLERRLAPVLLAKNLAGDIGRYGVLGTQALEDLGAMRRFLTGPGAINLFDAPWMPLFLAVIWLMNPWLGIVATVSAALLFMTGLVNELCTRGVLNEASAKNNEVMAALRTTLYGTETVLALGMKRAVLQSWAAQNDVILRLQGSASDRAGAIQAFARFERLGAQIAIVGAGGWLVIDQTITPGTLIASAIIVSRALAPAEGLIGSWRSVVGARTAYRRVLEQLAGVNERPRLQLPAPRGRLDVENISLMLPGNDRLTLHGVRFTLAEGESLGIVGPSASGKSTLARVILGLISPTSGTVRIDGADVSSWDPDLLGRHIGYVPQYIRLFPGTVGDNIARLGPREDALIVKAAQMAGAHEMILRLPHGYDTEIDPSRPAISGGQQQLIALARALYGEPRLLVLDEPNSNLDRDGEAALLSALARAREAGMTTIIIAHRPAIVSEVDRLLVLREGRVVMAGPRAEVLARTTGAVAPFKRPNVASQEGGSLIERVGREQVPS